VADVTGFACPKRAHGSYRGGVPAFPLPAWFHAWRDRRARRDRKLVQLGDHPLFAPLPRRSLGRVVPLVDTMWLPPGKVLARQGSLPVETFVINRGWAHVLLDGVAIGRLDQRQTVGISAKFHRVPFGSTVVTGSETEVFVVQPGCLRTFVELVPRAVSDEWSDFAPLGVERAVTAAG
jgi:hypothetical protein